MYCNCLETYNCLTYLNFETYILKDTTMWGWLILQCGQTIIGQYCDNSIYCDIVIKVQP